MWAHRLYSGPGYWNPLRPDLLAEQHLADTAQLAPLATTAAQLAAGQRWEAGLLTQLLAELTRGAPNQPAVRAALNELLAAALPRIVDLAVTAGHAELADLASLALQLAPQPDLAAQLADQMPQHSVRLAALAATLTSQQVTQYRADTIDGQPDAANRLASVAEQPVGLAGRPGPAGGRAGRERGSRHHPPGAGSRPARRRVPARPGRVAEQPGEPTWPAWAGGRRRWPRARKPSPSAGSWPRPARTRSGPTWPAR